MTRRNAASATLAALCSLLSAVPLLCQAALSAAGGVELSVAPAGSSWAQQAPLDKLTLRKGGRPNSLPTAQAPPTGDRSSPAHRSVD